MTSPHLNSRIMELAPFSSNSIIKNSFWPFPLSHFKCHANFSDWIIHDLFTITVSLFVQHYPEENVEKWKEKTRLQQGVMCFSSWINNLAHLEFWIDNMNCRIQVNLSYFIFTARNKNKMISISYEFYVFNFSTFFG